MADVRIRVNGQGYTIRCADGKEDRLQELAAYFDRQVAEMADQFGQVAESRLLILAGIRICEELFAARQNGPDPSHTELAAEIDRTAERLQRCATKLAGHTRNNQSET